MTGPELATEAESARGLPEIFGLILCMTLVLYLCGLGSKDLWTAAEARTALVAQSMVDSGDWVVPRINGEPYITKPPLYHWIVAFLSGPDGRVSVRTATLPAALSAVACVGAIMWLAARIYVPSAGLWAGVALASMPRFFWQGRVSEIDMMLTFSIVLCMLAFHYLHTTPVARRKTLWTIVFSASLAAAAMLKGPPGVLVVLLTILAFLLMRREMRVPHAGRFLLGLAIFLVLVVPWPAMMVGRVPSVLQFFVQESAGKVYRGKEHVHTIFYYIPQIIAGSFPWICFLPAGILQIRRDRTWRASLLPLAWAGVTFVFFTVIRTKQSHYVVPIYPALAILIGGTICSLIEVAEIRFSKEGKHTILAFVTGIAIASVALPVGVALKFAPDPLYVAGCSVSLLFAAAACRYYRQRRVMQAIRAGAAFMFVFLLQVILVLVPLMNQERSPRHFALEVARAVPDERPLGMYENVRPYMLFYVGREIASVAASDVEVFLASDRPAYLIVSERDLQKLPRNDDLTIVLSYKDFQYKKHKYLLVKNG